MPNDWTAGSGHPGGIIMFALAFQPKGIDYKQNTSHSNPAQSMLYYWGSIVGRNWFCHPWSIENGF